MADEKRPFEPCETKREKSVVALGMFDGVHAGHRRLLNEAASIAKENGFRLIVYTFQNHPLSVFGKAPKLLSGLDERVRLLRSFGADCVAADDFTLELAATEPEVFAKTLQERFSMAYAVAGFNYSFGKNGAGDTELLRELGKKMGFSVRELPPYLYEGEPVSSTRIRTLIERGEITTANAMLEREYALTGCVVRNRHIGSGIGFPTANLGGLEEMVLPQIGVYATRATVDDKTYNAVTSVGMNPTVGGKSLSVETYIMDFSCDIYGKQLTVAFVERLRGELYFESVEELAAQIAIDVENAKRVL